MSLLFLLHLSKSSYPNQYYDQKYPKITSLSILCRGSNHLGDTVTCLINKITDNNIEVSIGDNIKGGIKKSDLSRDKKDQRTDRFGIGDKVDATVIKIDKKQRSVNLSIKAREIEEEKQAMAEFGSSDSGASLGDILGAALEKKNQNENK